MKLLSVSLHDTTSMFSIPPKSVYKGVCVCVCLGANAFLFFFCACLMMLKHARLSVCVSVRACAPVCPYIDVCERPSRGAKSKASGHNWVTGTSDGLKHG